MEKFPANTRISPSRISVVEELSGDRTENDLLGAMTDIKDQNHWLWFLRVVFALNILFVRKRTTASSVQNICRSKSHPSSKIAVLVGSLVTVTALMDLGVVKCSRYSHSLLKRFEITTTLFSFLMGLSGVHREFEILRQVTGDDIPNLLEPSTQRMASFEFLSRLFAMDSASKLALVILPLVDVRKLFVLIRRRIFPGSMTNESKSCSHCHSNQITMPRRALPCGDIYCYYCSKTLRGNIVCSRCRERVSDWEPFIS